MRFVSADAERTGAGWNVSESERQRPIGDSCMFGRSMHVLRARVRVFAVSVTALYDAAGAFFRAGPFQ